MRYWLSLVVLLLLSGPASAQLVCSMTTSNINFGAINPLTTATQTAVGSYSVNCGLLGVFCPSIGFGSGGTGSSPRRRLLHSSGAFLEYDLYRDAGYTTPFGALDTPALGSPQIYANLLNYTGNIYARLYRGATIPRPGVYSASFAAGAAYLNYGLTAALGCGALTTRANTSFTVTATVQSQCSISAAPLNFGTTGVIRAAIDASTNLSVQCTPGTSYRISLDGGRYSPGNPLQRAMQGPGGARVRYDLYANPARTQPLGTASGNILEGSGSGGVQSVPVYGRVPVQPTPGPGVYSDIVVVTITY